MSDRLSRRATALLLGVAFGLTFSVQLLLSDGSSTPAPKAAPEVRAAVASAPAAAPKLRLVAAGTVPALREPRRPRKPRKPRKTRPKPTPARDVVKAAPRVEPEPLPTATVQPAPTAAPRYIPPRPQPKPKPAVPKLIPAPTPAPTAPPPPSGDFDTSGES